MGDQLVGELLAAIAVHPDLDVEGWLTMRNRGANAAEASELSRLGVTGTLFEYIVAKGLTYTDCVEIAGLGNEDGANYFNARLAGATRDEGKVALVTLGSRMSMYAICRRVGDSHDRAIRRAESNWA